VIVAFVAWGHFVGVVVVVMVVTAIMGIVVDVVNAGEVVGTGISADVADVTARNDYARALQAPVLCGDRGVTRVGVCIAGARVRG
jgi:hypothetical protein